MKADLSKIHVTVIGDSMLDRYIVGEYVKQAQEDQYCATYRQDRIVRCLGAAANVAANVVALGARANLITFVGDDIPGGKIKDLCKERGIALAALRELPLTTMKSRFMTNGEQRLRWDQENGSNAVGNRRAVADVIWRAVEDYDTDIVILSDYAKGFFSSDPYDQVNDLIRHDVRQRWTVLADPKPENWTGYSADIYTPNEIEALSFLGAEIAYQPAMGRKLCEVLRGSVAVTRGAQGVESYRDDKDDGRAYPAHCRAPVCVVGAGDTFIATLAVATAAGEGFHEAVEIANFAAGIAVSKPYTSEVTRRELDAVVKAGVMPDSSLGLAELAAGGRDPERVS